MDPTSSRRRSGKQPDAPAGKAKAKLKGKGAVPNIAPLLDAENASLTSAGTPSWNPNKKNIQIGPNFWQHDLEHIWTYDNIMHFELHVQCQGKNKFIHHLRITDGQHHHQQDKHYHHHHHHHPHHYGYRHRQDPATMSTCWPPLPKPFLASRRQRGPG